MNKSFRRILSLLLAAVVAFGTIGIGTTKAYAAKHEWALGGDFDSGVVYIDQPYIGFAVYDRNASGGGENEIKILEAKSSDSSILEIQRHKWNGQYYFDTFAKKKGTVTVTVKFKTPAGSKKTIKKEIRVKKYPKPIKSLKVAGKTIDLKENKYYYAAKTSKTSISIKAALQNGWKIDFAYGMMVKFKNGNPVSEKEVKITKKMIKNGTAIKFPKKYEYMNVSICLVKGDQYLWYQIDLNR